MKKLMTIISLAAAMIALGSCSKAVNEVSEPQVKIEIPDGMYEFTLNAVWTKLDDADETKTTYAGDQTFAWSAGDQISVLFHKDDDNQFFTLTNTTGAGAKATFSGAVTKGYTLGASDTGTKWALFPASAAHSYGGSDAVSFNEIADNDYTAPGAHFSVNIPMYAHGDASDNFVFKHLTGCYKLTFTNVSAAVSKVKLIAENIGNGYYLSGNSPILESDGTYYLNCYTGSGSTLASYTQNVSDGEVSFYIPYRAWERLTPNFTLINMTDGPKKDFTILKLTATSAIGAGESSKKSSLTKMIRLAPYNISAYGEGAAPASIDVDWSKVTPAYAGINDRILEWKTTSDTDYIYFYYKFNKSKYKAAGSSKFYIGFDTDNDSTTGSKSSNGAATTGGLEAMAYFYPWTGGSSDGAPDGVIDGEDPASWVKDSGDNYVAGAKVLLKGTFEGSYVYIEAAIPRAALGISVGSSVTVISAVQDYKTTAETVTY